MSSQPAIGPDWSRDVILGVPVVDSVTTKSFSPPPGGRSVLRAAAMMVGAGLLLWTTKASWALALTVATSVLLLLALLLPVAYAPFSRGLERLEKSTLQAFSWLVLGLLFVAIFIPGRLIIALRGGGRVVRKKKSDSYWETCKSIPSGDMFDQQF